MNSHELKNILKEQKKPLYEAAVKKLAYLKSDQVFTDITLTEWSDFIPDTDSAGHTSFTEAFGVLQPKANSSGTYQLQNTTPAKADQATKPTHQMTLAERISLLRGAASVTQSVASLRKR